MVLSYGKKPPFSYGFPMIFPSNHHFIMENIWKYHGTGKYMEISWDHWDTSSFMSHFPHKTTIFLLFSYDFPLKKHHFIINHRATTRPRTAARRGSVAPARRPRASWRCCRCRCLRCGKGSTQRGF